MDEHICHHEDTLRHRDEEGYHMEVLYAAEETKNVRKHQLSDKM